MTGIAGAETNAQVSAMRCATCGTEMEHPRVVLARHMLAWLAHMSHWTELPDDAVVLAVASPEPTEAVRITAGMIRECTR